MRDELNKLLYDICITPSDVIREMKINRNFYYSDEFLLSDKHTKFIEKHKLDWVFTPDKLKAALVSTGLTQLSFSKRYQINYVTINIFLSGKRRPTRASGDYQKIRNFCLFNCMF